MNYFDSELQNWLEHMNLVVPPTGVLVAGSGSGSWVQVLEQLDVPAVLLVEADAMQIERMKKAYTLPENWLLSQGLLWNEETSLAFHRASNPALNGVMPPDSFTHLWPNLTESGREPRRSETIDRLLDARKETSYNWFIIDCFPALPILEGAEAKIEECEVVLARVLSDQSALPEAGISKSEVDSWLIERGFRLLSFFDEDHPDVCFALYMRDWKAGSHREKLRLEALATKFKMLQAELKSAKNECSTLSNQKRELAEHVKTVKEKLTAVISEQKISLKERDDLQSKLDQLVWKSDALKTCNDEVERLKNELKQAQQGESEIRFSKNCILFNSFQQHEEGIYSVEAFKADWGDEPNLSSGVKDKRLKIVKDPDNQNNKVLRVTCLKGEIGGSSASVFKYKIMKPDVKSLWLQYKLRFDDDFDWVLGGKLPGLAGYTGKKPTGCLEPSELNGFSARFMWHQNGHLIQYMYSPTKIKPCGDDYITQKFFDVGKWYTITSYIQLNDMNKENGKVKAYLDGEQIIELKDIVLRNDPEVSINVLLFETFFGGGKSSWAPKKDEYIYFDDIVISEESPLSFVHTQKNS